MLLQIQPFFTELVSSFNEYNSVLLSILMLHSASDMNLVVRRKASVWVCVCVFELRLFVNPPFQERLNAAIVRVSAAHIYSM